MARKRKATTTSSDTRPVKRSRSKRVPLTVSFDPFTFPFLGHQQLNPAEFPATVGIPIRSLGRTPKVEEAPVDIDNDLHEFSHQEDARNGEHEGDYGETDRPAPCATNPCKRLRIAGGRPAVAKKVTADLDSDDELIVSMKAAKYLERDIAKRLEDEGRMKYNAKTIGTRWRRLKKKLRERTDDLLDAELTDWHDGDDDVLQQAKASADLVIDKLIADLETKRWRLIADNIKAIKPVTNFSANACKARHEALQNGCAKPTPESIVNPDTRTQDRIEARRKRDQKLQQTIANLKSSESSSIGPDGVSAELADLAKANRKGNGWNSKTNSFDC